MPPTAYHLAHLNVAVAREALDHPSMADFVAQLGPVNGLARASPGFVWGPEGEEAGSAVAVFGSERALPNLSVWAGPEDLRRFVYEGLHAQALDRRSEWFEEPRGPAYVLWWVPAGHRPDLAEAKRRLEHLAAHGPTPLAFTFKESFEAPGQAALDGWIAREAIPFSLDSPETLNAAVDRVTASLGDSVELLGFGEALHGGEELLVLRNRLFRRLAEAHGYSAIAIESSFPRARLVNEFVAGGGPSSYEEVQDAGFGHGFGRLEANRELVEWMRLWNSDPSRRVKLRFYGFDIPSAPTGIAGPRRVLQFAVDYLSSMDGPSGEERRRRIETLLGQDSDWENPAVYADPTKSVGLSPSATTLRIETEDLITELLTRRPELVAGSDASRYAEALQYASVARQLLGYHAALARKTGIAGLLGIRDALMADNLAYVVERERGRGKVLAFAHNAHLQRGKLTVWPTWQKALGSGVFSWWPAGAHLDQMLGPRYAVVGSAVGVSEANGIAQPEAGTLEARLTASPGPARFIPTHGGRGLPAAEIAALPARSGSTKNLSYIGLGPQSFTDFDWLAVLDTTAYNRGGPGL